MSPACLYSEFQNGQSYIIRQCLEKKNKGELKKESVCLCVSVCLSLRISLCACVSLSLCLCACVFVCVWID